MFFTTSVLWQIVNLEDEEEGIQGEACSKKGNNSNLLIIQAQKRHENGHTVGGGACNKSKDNVKSVRRDA